MMKKNIVVIGGGTGISSVVSGLKNEPVELTALVSVADSGGSTGRLRDEFGFQPVGDLRQSLAALAKEKSQEWIRKLLLYRFEKGTGLNGHNLGNLILTALQDMAGSTTSALEIAEHIFQLNGKIYPVTSQNVQLVVEYVDGSVVVGEHRLDNNGAGNKKIKRIRLSPRAKLYKKAEHAILNADLIVIGPGDYYGSILAALSVDGIKRCMRATSAKIVYVVNLMTRFTQTYGMTARDHQRGIEEAIGRTCDLAIVNSKPIPAEILAMYGHEQEYPIVNDLPKGKYISADLLSSVRFVKVSSDLAHRSYLRHDAKKLAKVLMRVVK